MIVLPSGAHVWPACGYADMRKGMDGLAMLAQQVLAEDPFGGALFAFRGKRGGLIKLLWFDGRAFACSASGWREATSSGPSPTPGGFLWACPAIDVTGEVPVINKENGTAEHANRYPRGQG
jgi:hypothetical protein